MAVLAFYSDRYRKSEDMESQCNWHGLTPSREVWPTACRCCAAPAAEAAILVYHDSTGFARGCPLPDAQDLTVAAGADIIEIEKGTATSGWPFLVIVLS